MREMSVIAVVTASSVAGGAGALLFARRLWPPPRASPRNRQHAPAEPAEVVRPGEHRRAGLAAALADRSARLEAIIDGICERPSATPHGCPGPPDHARDREALTKPGLRRVVLDERHSRDGRLRWQRAHRNHGLIDSQPRELRVEHDVFDDEEASEGAGTCAGVGGGHRVEEERAGKFINQCSRSRCRRSGSWRLDRCSASGCTHRPRQSRRTTRRWRRPGTPRRRPCPNRGH